MCVYCIRSTFFRHCYRPRVARHCQTDWRTPLYYIIIVITKNRRRVSLQWRWRGGDWITKTTAVYSSPTSESRVYFYDTTKRRPATAPAPATHYLRQFIFYNIFRSDIFVAQKIKSTAVIAINDCVHIMSSNEN